jgi:adenylate kinase
MHPESPNFVLFIGRPGSGKGTQAKLIAERLGWVRLSSGDRFKTLRDSTGALGDRIRAAYDKGEYMPDWFADYLLEQGIVELDPETGVVAEGFGRTRTQAAHLKEILSWLGRKLVVVHLDVPEQMAKERMMSRGKIEHRPDSDNDHKIQSRFSEYTENTEPALDYFREHGLVIEVNGAQPADDILEDVLAKIQVA